VYLIGLPLYHFAVETHIVREGRSGRVRIRG